MGGISTQGNATRISFVSIVSTAKLFADMGVHTALIGACATVVAMVGLTACGAPAADTEATHPPVLAVELIAPTPQRWPDRVSASGEVAAWQEAVIGTEVAGVRLQEVLADVGDEVKRGQLLARYDDAALRVDLARLDAAVAEAESNLTQARANEVRANRLEETQALSNQMVQEYRTKAEVAQAHLDSARALREAQRLKLRYARVTAPDDGVITSRSATLGAVGMLGGELYRLLRGGRLEWRAEVPAEGLARLHAGAVVQIRRADGEIVSGTLRQRSPTVDSRSRNGIAYVDLPADSALAAGMYVTGDFVLDAREALAVPESAIVLRDGYSYLMTVNAEGRIRSMKVMTGRRRDGEIEVLEGVTAADRVVKSGGAFLGDGDLVSITAAGL